MAARAALVTGASSGIGFAIAEMLGSEGYGLTIASRRPDKLTAAGDALRAKGYDVQEIAGNLGDEDTIKGVVAAHAERFGRLDVLVNNAGVGMGEQADQLTTKKIDIQLATNIRSIFLFYREAIPLLRAAGAEHRNAHVINTSSISGKQGEAWLSVYSATKHAVVGYTQAMNKELGSAGIKSCALCPAFVDTPMTDFIKEHVPAETMIQPTDISEFCRYLINTSPGCVVPEAIFAGPGGGPQIPA